MLTPRIRIVYAAIDQMGRVFGTQAQQTQETIYQLRHTLSALEGGDWVGRGATAFYAEMHQTVLPALHRLVAALVAAQALLQQVNRIMQQAEAEAAALFGWPAALGMDPPPWQAEGLGWWATAYAQQHGQAPTPADYAEFKLSWQLSGEGTVVWNDADWAAFYHAQRRGLAKLLAEGVITPPLTGVEVLARVNEVNYKDIQGFISNGQYQAAIDLAIVAYAIDTTGVTKPPVFFAETLEEGGTDSRRAPQIGPSAFTTPGALASTIEHEMVHVRQTLGGRLYSTEQGRIINEVEAYDWELAHAPYFGLTPAEVAELQRRRNDENYALLTPENQRIVDGGQYVILGEPLYQPTPQP